MAYEVSKGNEADLGQVLCPVWQRNLDIGAGAGERFRWSHELNPAGSCATFLLSCAREAGSEVVGSTTIFPRRLRALGQEIAGGILGDLAVDRAHRTLFPALALQRAARAFGRAHLGVIYGMPNQRALPIYDRLRFTRLGEMVRYSLPLCLEDNVPSELPLLALLRRGARIVDRARASWSRFDRRTVPADYQLELVDGPDARFDELWERASRSFTIIGRRDSAFLRWRFCDKPDDSFRLATLARGDRLEAYAVLQARADVVSIRDLLAADDTELRRLIRLLVPDLRAHGARAATFRFLAGPWLAQILEQEGFVARGDTWPVVVDLGDELAVSREVLLDKHNWYLTDADEDS